MSLAAAGVLPDLVSGVIAVCGAVPEIRDWQPLSGEAGGLPILLVSDPNDSNMPPNLIRRSIDALKSWGASVTHQEIADARSLGLDVSMASRNWLRSQIAQPQAAELIS